MIHWTRALALASLCLAWSAPSAHAQGASTWFLAEGANNATFTEEILIGNSTAQALDVTVTLLPQSDALAPTLTRTFALAASSRLTVRLAADFGLNGSSSARVTAVLAGTSTPADIVVERTMYFAGAAQPGAHNASGVTSTAARWTLAEGANGVFETFVLVANPNATPTRVRATYLTSAGQALVSEQQADANGRVTFWPRAEFPALATAEFSTEIESLTAGNNIVAERAMYLDEFRSGHDALGVTAPSTTWLFAEGFTGGNATTAFETFVLLANTGTTESVATVEYLLDNGQIVTRAYTVPARRRFTVWVDHEGRTFDNRLAAAAFGIRVTATTPIVAERAMYWGTPSAADPATPTFPWLEGHATAGVVAGETKWAFAEGQQGNFGATATRYDTFFLLANPNSLPVTVRATFVREDGRGIMREVCLAPNARTNIWTAAYPELGGQRFATFLESVASASPQCTSAAGTSFVAERAVYYGAGFTGGHVNVGTRWTAAIATPPVAPAFALSGVAPDRGRIGGGQAITITGAGFQQGARVVFVNPAWTGDRNANTVLPSVDEAGSVVVSQDGTSITARTPARDFYNGYQTAGPVTVRVINPDATTTELANGYTFQFNVLVFGDDFVFGSADGGGRATRPFPDRLRTLLTGYTKGLLDPGTGGSTGQSVVQFGSFVQVTNAGVVGECASATGAGCIATAGAGRFPALADATGAPGGNGANAYDAVVFLEGINDIRAGVLSTSVRNALRGMIVNARDRRIVIVMTRLFNSSTSLISPSALTDLGTQIFQLTEEQLNVEIYRQSLENIQSGGAYPTQSGYDAIAQLVFDKVAREFPLQPCDARADKPGRGCPRNP